MFLGCNNDLVVPKQFDLNICNIFCSLIFVFFCLSFNDIFKLFPSNNDDIFSLKDFLNNFCFVINISYTFLKSSSFDFFT